MRERGANDGTARMPPAVTVVVVTYNVRDLVQRCLASLHTGEPRWRVESVVVDNASSDDTVAAITAAFPDVHLIANRTNRGFGAAANQALARARGEFLLFLNPDAELCPGALDALVQVLRTQPDAGIVGPLLRYPDGRIQPSRRRFPTPLLGLVESTVVQRWWPDAPALRRYYLADRPADCEQDVDWLVGACLLARRSLVSELGGFDERFFMYSEEVDLCRRARDAGWRIVYCPRAEVIHHEGRSSEQNLQRRALTFAESKARYFEKYFGPGVGRALRLYLLANTLYDLILEAAKLTVGHRPELRRARLAALAGVALDQIRRLGSPTDEPATRGLPVVAPSAPEGTG